MNPDVIYGEGCKNMFTFSKIDQHKNEAIYLYCDKRQTLEEIGFKYGCSAETVKRRFAEWNVHVRSLSERMKGVKKDQIHAQKLRDNLAKQRPKAETAMKKLWSTYDGKKISRKDFLDLIRSKGNEKRRINKSSSGEKNPSWRGGVSFRYFKQKVLARDGRICKMCGYNEHPEIIEVHHKDGNHGNNDLENGMPVCPNCHRIEEFKNKTFHTKLRPKRYE